MKDKSFAEVILPLPLRGTFTYAVPDSLKQGVEKGCRVEVQFGRKRIYSGLVHSFHGNEPQDIKVKEIIDLIDERPVVSESHIQFWTWIAKYYACSLGEVMNAAFPSAMKLNSQSSLVPGFACFEEHNDLSDDEYLLWEALQDNREIQLDTARSILGKKNIARSLETLIYKGIAELKEELEQKFKPARLVHIKLREEFLKNPDKALELTVRSEFQTNALLTIFQKKGLAVPKTELLSLPAVKEHAIQGLIKKGIVESFEKDVSRLKKENTDYTEGYRLSDHQLKALGEIEEQWSSKRVVLLHGVTGSGKTLLYKEFIEKTIESGGQVLFLLPEIALTSQVVRRLEKMLDAPVYLYHSRENIQKRTEVWKAAAGNARIIMGARSSVFLPFHNLRLVIVDEEHDPSYKQHQPAPLYNGKDAAVYLAHLTNARVLLGTATPSLESFYNAKNNKYGYVKLDVRYGEASLPEIELIDIKHCTKKKKMKGPFSDYLLETIEEMWQTERQVILFQNRRGFAPVVQCENCSFVFECHQCDVSLTYHKRFHEMKCHHCSYTSKLPKECPACGSGRLGLLGIGTEKVEEEIQLLLPGIKTARLDSDTARSRKNLQKIIYEFENGLIDVLIGTQMVTKGLDFDNVGLVGILDADRILNFPDFRSAERGFQLMTQVSGRAGRTDHKGKVIIQSSNTSHPVLLDVLNFNYKKFYHRELSERGKYHYPPIYRNFVLELKHKDLNTVWKASRMLKNRLEKEFPGRILGPSEPMIPRVRNLFILELMMKIEKDSKLLEKVKFRVFQLMDHLRSADPYKRLRFKLDVDPY